MANPDGTKALGSAWVGHVHRRSGVSSVPEILTRVVVEEDGKRIKKRLPFDKSKIYLYIHRHT
ncbi:hypothetical protein [Streptomyces sp. NPDC048710]|uniref:hypothetical protein n=1 Tax=Streptomyces sp. NPDC048710 TaxID=3365586 RepID=UPI0037175852